MVQNDWRADGNTWNYLGPDGRMVTGLYEVTGQANPNDNGWYYLNPKHDGTYGAMLVGWRQIGVDWYFFETEHKGFYGLMVHNAWREDGNTWNYLGGDGRMVVGLHWVNDGKADDGLYYLNPFHDGTYGDMQVGWQQINGDWYYFETRHNGLYGKGYVGGTYAIDGIEYAFDSQGRLQSWFEAPPSGR